MTKVEVRRDNEVKATFASGDVTQDQNDAFVFILKNQPQSVDWAVRYEGWSIDVLPEPRPLHKIADEIVREWPNPYFGAKPYLQALRYLNTIDDKFGEDTAKDVIVYFLSNATTWRGAAARRVKAELKGIAGVK